MVAILCDNSCHLFISQAVVVDAIADINLEVKGSSSLVLSDLSEFATLPFVAAFDVVDKSHAAPAGSFADASKRPPPKRVTYIALSKYAMPKLVDLYQRFKGNIDIYVDGTLERLLSVKHMFFEMTTTMLIPDQAYSIPIKLKYDCPAPSKFGNDLPLWKTATVSFLRIVKELAKSMNTFREGEANHILRVAFIQLSSSSYRRTRRGDLATGS